MTARALEYRNLSADGALSNYLNYYDLTNAGVAASLPATGDTLYFNDGSIATTGFSQGAVQLAALYFGPTWTGQVGVGGTSWTIGADYLEYNGRGQAFITGGTGHITLAVIGGNSQFTCSGGQWTTLTVGPSGNCYVPAGATVVNYKSSGGSCTMDTGTGMTTCKVGSGTLTSARSYGSGSIGQGGNVKLTLAAASTAIDVSGGGTLTLNNTGTNALIEVFALGTLSTAGAIYLPTVTTLVKYAGANIGTSMTPNIFVGGAQPI
jgi:hypothetical protein